VHDQAELERAGIPAVMVASSEFVDAAQVQADSLGFDPVRVFVPHPIQDRTDDELCEIAEGAVDDILRGLTGAEA
jgi:hypothetical protein